MKIDSTQYRFFVTAPDTDFGQQLRELAVQRVNALNAARAFTFSVGACSYVPWRFVFAGGISGMRFAIPDAVDTQVWWPKMPLHIGVWVPRRDTPEGRDMHQRICNLPFVTSAAANALIGWRDRCGKSRLRIDVPLRQVTTSYGFAVERWVADLLRCLPPAREVDFGEYSAITFQSY